MPTRRAFLATLTAALGLRRAAPPAPSLDALSAVANCTYSNACTTGTPLTIASLEQALAEFAKMSEESKFVYIQSRFAPQQVYKVRRDAFSLNVSRA